MEYISVILYRPKSDDRTVFIPVKFGSAQSAFHNYSFMNTTILSLDTSVLDTTSASEP